MATLPANSTFLPVLDDLLSPDFRTVCIPGMTPQTPAETPVSTTAAKVPSFAENHTGQLTTKIGFTALEPQAQNQMNGSVHHVSKHQQNQKHQVNQYSKPHHDHNAASKIQKWWKSKNARVKVENGTDIKAERVKHSIRHSRTEDHVRFLETEVHRLKSALTTERKLRSLQLEAIRSLWSQVQKVSSISLTPPSSARGESNIMSQSMPNVLPTGEILKEKQSSGCMSMSLHGGLAQPQNVIHEQNESPTVCECTKEIKNLRESLTGEMAQLRNMIDQLKVGGGNQTPKKIDSEPQCTDESKISQQKRPLTLNLVGISGKDSQKLEELIQEKEGSKEKKEEIAGYANQMASSILEGAVDDTEEDQKE